MSTPKKCGHKVWEECEPQCTKPNRDMGFTDYVHVLTGFLLGLMGPFGGKMIDLVIHREYIQEQEKREANRAGFDLEMWGRGYVPGLVVFYICLIAFIVIVTHILIGILA